MEKQTNKQTKQNKIKQNKIKQKKHTLLANFHDAQKENFDVCDPFISGPVNRDRVNLTTLPHPLSCRSSSVVLKEIL